MSLKTDLIFAKALRSNAELMSKLPAKDVYNTTIPVPDEELDNAPLPYIIITFDGLTNEDGTKDCSYEGSTDRVQIGIEVVASSREELAQLTTSIRKTVREYFENIEQSDEDYDLVPYDYTFSAQKVQWDQYKPAYGQVLNYNCETNIDKYEQEES